MHTPVHTFSRRNSVKADPAEIETSKPLNILREIDGNLAGEDQTRR